MKSKHLPLILAILALEFVSLACQAATGTEPVPTGTSPLPQVEPATIGPQGAGILCVGTTNGLSCLNEEGWQVYTDENSDLPNKYLYSGAVCPDGQFVIGHINGVVLFDGTGFKQIPEMEGSPTPEGIACEENGGIWVAHFQGVSHYAGGQWTTYGSDQLASGESVNDLVYDVKVAPDGKVWVVTSRSVAMFENGTWIVFQEGQGFNGSRFFNALALDIKGRPWAAHSSGVDVFDNGEWTEFEKDGYNSPESLAADARGDVWYGTLVDGVHLFDGASWTHYDRASGSLSSDDIASISADSGGRVWFGTSYGLTVFDGVNWQTLQMSNSGLSDNNIEFVLVINDGPAVPALKEKEKGSFTGILEKADGTPLADVTVEICVETLASTFSGDTPCANQPFFLSTKTDANGVFIIEAVPAGYYVIVAETNEGSWAQLTDQFGISSERTMIQAGEQYDIGTLTLEE